MLLGLSLMSQKGLASSLVHMVNHGFTKAALFMSLGAFMLNTKNVYSKGMYENVCHAIKIALDLKIKKNIIKFRF